MKTLYTLVGMKWRNTAVLVSDMKRGTHLILRRAPDNEHDRNAIEVWHGTQHIAFIKASEAVSLAKQMDLLGLREVPSSYVIGADRWPQVEVDTR